MSSLPIPQRLILIHTTGGTGSGTVFSCFKEVSDVFKCKDVKHSNYFSVMSKQWVTVCQLFKNINFFFKKKKLQSFLETFSGSSVLKKLRKQHEAPQRVNPTGQSKGQMWGESLSFTVALLGPSETHIDKRGSSPWFSLLLVPDKPATQEKQRPFPFCSELARGKMPGSVVHLHLGVIRVWSLIPEVRKEWAQRQRRAVRTKAEEKEKIS